MSDQEQAKHIRDRMSQYIPTPISQPEASFAQTSTGSTAVDTPAYNPSTLVQEPEIAVNKTTQPEHKYKEFSAVKAGLILLISLLISGALIIYALTRFIG